MKNPNNLKSFAMVGFGSATVASGLNGDAPGDGMVLSPPLVSTVSQYGPQTGINPNGVNGAVSTSVQVIDVNGDPLVSAHLKWSGGGAITDANGEAAVNVPSENTQITISYVGKRSHIAKAKDLVNAMVTLQDNVNNLPPVKVGQNAPVASSGMSEKNKKMLKNIAIGVGAIFLIAALSSNGKKGSAKRAVGLNAPKTKKGKKNKSAKKGKKRKGLREPAPQITL